MAMQENKPVNKMTMQELEEAIKEREQSITLLEAQDESGFSDFDKCVKGKEVNIPLCGNHIAYYRAELSKRLNNSLMRYVK